MAQGWLGARPGPQSSLSHEPGTSNCRLFNSFIDLLLKNSNFIFCCDLMIFSGQAREAPTQAFLTQTKTKFLKQQSGCTKLCELRCNVTKIIEKWKTNFGICKSTSTLNKKRERPTIQWNFKIHVGQINSSFHFPTNRNVFICCFLDCQ